MANAVEHRGARIIYVHALVTTLQVRVLHVPQEYGSTPFADRDCGKSHVFTFDSWRSFENGKVAVILKGITLSPWGRIFSKALFILYVSLQAWGQLGSKGISKTLKQEKYNPWLSSSPASLKVLLCWRGYVGLAHWFDSDDYHTFEPVMGVGKSHSILFIDIMFFYGLNFSN